MGKNHSIFENQNIKEIRIPAFGLDLIRHISIPDLLGEDSDFIQYYMGKSLARKFPLKDIDAIIQFFQQAGFGLLTLVKEKNNEISFSMTSILISERFEYEEEISYRLEAGFLAQQLTNIKNETFECVAEPKKRKETINFYAVTSI